MTRQGHIITFVCSALYEVDLYARLRPGLERRGWTVVMVTSLFSAWWRARRQGVPCTLSRATRKTPCPVLATGVTPEEILAYVTPDMASRFRHSLWDALERSAQNYPPDVIVQWNGQGLGGLVATAFAKARDVQTLYFELGNIEPKLFVDHQGVNAASELASHPEILDRYDITDEEIRDWKDALILRRRAITTIPQAQRLLRLNPWFVVDKIVCRLTGAPCSRRQSIIGRLLEKLRLARRKTIPAVCPERPYIFLPLQVSRDSNLLVFSDYDNLTAMDFAARHAEKHGLLLVVKPHPAETDMQLLDTLIKRCAEQGGLLTSYNTTDLILGAEEVVTINSTVGLEAKALGIPVTTLGRCLYEHMTPRQIAALAMHRLVDFPPFGLETASEDAVAQLLSLLRQEPPGRRRA